jgi:uncharacterized integral membrane protein
MIHQAPKGRTMQFLKILFWVVLTIALVLFADANWTAVTLNLWGGLRADVKLPLLVLASFLLGFLPMLILHRARIWSLRRRLEPHERNAALARASAAAPAPAAAPVPVNNGAAGHDERVATDSPVWPTA